MLDGFDEADIQVLLSLLFNLHHEVRPDVP